jgi:hypothetical protein
LIVVWKVDVIKKGFPMMTGGRKCAMPFTEFAPDLCGACMASITPEIVLN